MWRAGFSEDSPLASLGGSTAKKVPSLGMQPRQLCTLRKEQKKKSFGGGISSIENMSSQFYHLLFSIELTLSIPFRNN